MSFTRHNLLRVRHLAFRQKVIWLTGVSAIRAISRFLRARNPGTIFYLKNDQVNKRSMDKPSPFDRRRLSGKILSLCRYDGRCVGYHADRLPETAEHSSNHYSGYAYF
jgi:hypothetical protein